MGEVATWQAEVDGRPVVPGQGRVVERVAVELEEPVLMDRGRPACAEQYRQNCERENDDPSRP